MTKQEIYAFISKVQDCTLATIEGDKPRVRGMKLYRAESLNDSTTFAKAIADIVRTRLAAQPCEGPVAAEKMQ